MTLQRAEIKAIVIRDTDVETIYECSNERVVGDVVCSRVATGKSQLESRVTIDNPNPETLNSVPPAQSESQN